MPHCINVILSSYFPLLMLERIFTIYIMHRMRGGIYIVDKLTEFSIPNSKDQLYALKKRSICLIIWCMFVSVFARLTRFFVWQSRVMDYYLAVQKIPSSTKTYTSIKESPTEASPSKTSNWTSKLLILQGALYNLYN